MKKVIIGFNAGFILSWIIAYASGMDIFLRSQDVGAMWVVSLLSGCIGVCAAKLLECIGD